MINFKITSLLDGNLSLDAAQGKSVLLKPGEVVTAQVMNVLESGDVLLKIKGELITARTEVPLQQGDTALFKVSDSGQSGLNQLKLQFVGYENASQENLLPDNFMSTAQGQILAGLIQELSDSLPVQQGVSPAAPREKQDIISSATQQEGIPAGDITTDKFPLDKVESLLKALPADINALPQNVKTQLQDLLLSSIKSTGQSIQSRVDTLVEQISDTVKNSTAAGTFEEDIGNFKADIIDNMERMFPAPLKNALLNTGVAFEAKLKSAVLAMQADTIDAQEEITASDGTPAESPIEPGINNIPGIPAGPVSAGAATPDKIHSGDQAGEKTAEIQPKEAAVSGFTDDKGRNSIPAIQNDLKAVLLELKQRLLATEGKPIQQDLKAAIAEKGPVHDAGFKNLQGTIEGLLKDIETFQALSKTTDSFYTFLPVNWKELKDGELSFKRGRAGTQSGSSCSCRINLDLADSGSLSVMVFMHDKDFFVSFKADAPETHSVIENNLGQLKTSFMQKGMSLKAAHMLDQNDTSMEKLDKLGSSDKLINIKV